MINWDKGKAVTFLLESLGKYVLSTYYHEYVLFSMVKTMTKNNKNALGLSNCEDVLPIYVGDDQTDEDAFKVRGTVVGDLFLH